MISLKVSYFPLRYEWYKDNKLHRDDDLPALVYLDGTKLWYKNGKLHRDNDKPAYDSEEVKKWYKNGELHRENDKPALCKFNGERHWYKNGQLHRDGKPAIITEYFMYYYINGQLHREDGPTQIAKHNKYINKYKNKVDSKNNVWYQNGKVHRENDLPAMETEYGKGWALNWKLHRDNDLPAVEFKNGLKAWFKDGVLHRNDGPALLWEEHGVKEYWFNGRKKSQTQDIKTDDVKKQCLICCSNKATVIYIPCGHIFACSECSETIPKNECSICRQVPNAKYIAYYPE